MTACAITDHEVAYGLVDFYKKKRHQKAPFYKLHKILKI